MEYNFQYELLLAMFISMAKDVGHQMVKHFQICKWILFLILGFAIIYEMGAELSRVWQTKPFFRGNSIKGGENGETTGNIVICH